MSTRPSHNRTTSRKGAILVLSALLMVFILGMVAFAVDIGYILCARTEAQRAADSGALAGAGVFDDNYQFPLATITFFWFLSLLPLG